MYATTTHSAVVQVWENHRTLFVAHCSKAEDHFEEAMLKRVFFCIMSPATEFHHKKIRPTTRKMSFLPSNCHGSTDETNTCSFVGHFDFS